MDDPFEIEPTKDVGVHYGAPGDNKQVSIEVLETGDVVSTIVMNLVVPLQNVGDILRSNTGPPLQEVGSSLNLPALGPS